MLTPRLMLAIIKCRMRRGTGAERGLSSPQQRKESGWQNLFEAVESHKVAADWKVRAPLRTPLPLLRPAFLNRPWLPVYLAMLALALLFCGCTPPGPRALMKGQRL